MSQSNKMILLEIISFPLFIFSHVSLCTYLNNTAVPQKGVETSSWRHKKSYDQIDIVAVQISFDLKSQHYKERQEQKEKSEKKD